MSKLYLSPNHLFFKNKVRLYCNFGFVVIKKLLLYGSFSQNRISQAVFSVLLAYISHVLKGKTGLYYLHSMNCSVSENGCFELVDNFTVVRCFMIYSAMLFDFLNLTIILERTDHVSPRINFIYHILVVFNVYMI